jgi:tetratricopeptide (TPR) repeat protein
VGTLGFRDEASQLLVPRCLSFLSRLSEAKFGPDHPDTLRDRASLGLAYMDAGRLSEAIVMHEATQKLLHAKLGPDRRATLINRESLACAYLASGRLTDAHRQFEATLEMCEAKLGLDHPVTLETRGNLPVAAESPGRFSQAEALLRDMLARLRNGAKPNDLLMTTALTELGRNLLEQGNCSEAEPLLREAGAIIEKASPDDWN